MSKPFISALTFLILSGCATHLDQSKQIDIDAFAALMEGIYETASDDPDNSIRDRRLLVNSPNMDGVWLYYQLNTGPDKNKLYRQRIINLALSKDEAVIIQKTYGLKEAERLVDVWDNPSILTALSADDIEPYFGEGCEQTWRLGINETTWTGYVDPKTCRIFSERRQADIFIESEARLDEKTYQQTERGFDSDGEQLFGTLPGDFAILYRQ